MRKLKLGGGAMPAQKIGSAIFSQLRRIAHCAVGDDSGDRALEQASREDVAERAGARLPLGINDERRAGGISSIATRCGLSRGRRSPARRDPRAPG